MSPLFGNREEKRATEAAAQAEIARFIALSVWELAAQILPMFGSEGSYSRGIERDFSEQFADDTAKALVAPGAAEGASSRQRDQLRVPVMEAIQALENAGLLLRTFTRSTPYNQKLQITRHGERALTEGTASVYLRDPATE